MSPADAHAADGTWNTDAGGSWNTSTTSPWLNTTIAQGADFTASFKYNITGNRTISLTESLTIGNLYFEDVTSSHDWTLAGSILTLDTTTGTAPVINVVNRTATISTTLAGDDGLTKTGSGTLVLTGTHAYTGTTTISAGKLQLGNSNTAGNVSGNIVNNSALEVHGGNSASTVLSGVISGSGTITKYNSASSLTLSGNNTYTGATNLSDGALLLGSDSALGAGVLNVSRGRVGSADGARTITNTVNFNLNGSLTLGAAQGSSTGLGDLTFTSGASGAGNAITVNNATTVTLGTQFTSGFITKNGTGTLVLNGANSSYTGATKINGGVLSVAKLADINTTSSIGKGSSGGSASDLVLAGGTLRFTGASSGATNRLFSLGYGTSGAASVFEASGDAPLQFTATGDIGIAFNSANTPWSGADIAAGTTQFTLNDVSQVAVGMGITGTNIAAGTYVSAIDTATRKITLSQGITGAITADGSLTFSLYGGPRTLTLAGSNTGSNTLASNLTDASSSNGSRTDLLSHAASLIKDGTGTWVISGAHTYTGATTINAGTLVVDGSIGSGSAVTVNNTGTLAGSGTIGGTVALASGATISPGNSPGMLTTGSQTWSGGATYDWQVLDFNGTMGTSAGYDLISISGALDLSALSAGSPFNLNLLSLASTGPDVSGDAANFNNAVNGSWTLVTTTGGITGYGADASVVGSLFNVNTSGFSNDLAGGAFTVGISGNDLVLNFTAASAIPEPSTYAAIAGALALGAVILRRRLQRAQA